MVSEMPMIAASCHCHRHRHRYRGTEPLADGIVYSPRAHDMLSMLLAAHLAGRTINVWYTASAAPGTNKNNGCTDETMATLNRIGVN